MNIFPVRVYWRLTLVAILLICWQPWRQAKAADTLREGTLELTDVLEAVDGRHPEAEIADRQVEIAKAESLAARGVWDPFLQTKAYWKPEGFYTNRQFDATVRQATPYRGIGFFAGYRQGRGTYPTYKRELETLSDGEARAGIEVPLLKDGSIDENRATIRQRELAEKASYCSQFRTRNMLRLEALLAYTRWLANGLEVEIQRELLELANARDSGIRDQTRAGSLPEISVSDNQRQVVDRESKLVLAKRSFRQAATVLSLYLRDRSATPILPDRSQLPEELEVLKHEVARSLEREIERAIEKRPVVCEIKAKLLSAEVEKELAENQILPRLNAEVFTARDYGEGAEDLEETEVGIGVNFAVPLLLRKERGRLRAAKEKVKSLQRSLDFRKEQVAVDVQQARVNLETASRQLSLAKRQKAVALKLAEAEREKFRQGLSELLIVNLRELAAANAARDLVEAKAAVNAAAFEKSASLGENLMKFSDRVTR